jgi:DNA topoisomerase IB
MTHLETTFQPKDDLRKQLRHHREMHKLYKAAFERQSARFAELSNALAGLRKQAEDLLAMAQQTANKQTETGDEK